MVRVFIPSTKVLPHVIDPVADFGAVGDGVTDNGDALMAMRQYMADRWDQHFEVRFPYGYYVYDKNLWISGVGSVTVDGGGGKFECVSTSSIHANTRPLWARPFFDEEDAAEPLSSSGSGAITGCPQARFERAVAGSTVLTLKPAITGQPHLEVTDLAAGDRVFIWAFDGQFWGYPPNARYFEWNEIESVDTGAGTVTIKFPLHFDYEEDLPSFETWNDVWYGSARLFKLDRPSGYRYPRYVELRNMNIEPNRNNVGLGHGIRITADHFVMNNVAHKQGYLWLGFNRIAEVRHCEFGNNDLDKLVGSAYVTDSIFHSIFGPASGFLNVTVERCRIKGSVKVCARNNYINNNWIFTGVPKQAIIMDSVTSIKNFEVKGNVIVPSAGLSSVVYTRWAGSTTIIPDMVQGREILLDNTDANRDHIRAIDVGNTLISGDTAGKITRIWYDDSNTNWHIETDFEQLYVGQNYGYVLGNKLIYSENEVVGRLAFPIDHYELAFKNGPIDLTVPTSVLSENLDLKGFVSKIEVRVVRPQQNVPSEFPDPLFRVRAEDSAGSEVSRVEIDPTQTGIKSTGLAGDIGAVTTSLPPNQFVSRLELQAWGKTPSDSSWERGWTGDDADKPIVRVRIEGQSIL